MSSISWDMILGGFGLFMFGISFMGDGLKSVAGDQLRDYIDKYTSSTFSAVIIGIILTIIMQSSSASIAITIGLVRAGLMNLTQAAGIVMGANIGTTVTSFLIGLSIDQYAMYIVFLGAMLICFCKKQKMIYWGNVIFGFGLMFYGLSTMGDGLAALKEMPIFSDFALSMASKPWLAMFAGLIITALVQSSAATIGVVQKLYQAGAISLTASLPFMFGANIGTTITGILAALGGSLPARRTAAMHTVFNIIGTLLGMFVLAPYTLMMNWITTNFSVNPMLEIAIANMIFKTVTTILFLPILKPYTAFIKKIIPGEEKERLEVDVTELDENVTNVLPSAAVSAAQQSILKMFDVVRQDIVMTQEYLNKPGTDEDREILNQNEDTINKLDKKITEYLINLQQHDLPLTPKDINDTRIALDAVKNLERIGDLSMNLTEFFEMVHNDKGNFTSIAVTDINNMFTQLVDMLDDSAEIFITRDTSTFAVLNQKEDKLDSMEANYRTDHFRRMADKECTSAVAASVYCDILGTLERMGDHTCNIAKSSLFHTDEKTSDSLFPLNFK